MLSVRPMLNRDGVEVSDVACRHTAGVGDPHEQAAGHALVLVRRGSFARTADGVQMVLDPTVAYCMNPGEEQRYDHSTDQGDDCTSLFLRPAVVASLWGGEPRLPTGPLPVSPVIDLEHRLLLGSLRRGADPDELLERTIVLIAAALEQRDACRVASGRPSGIHARAAIVDGARQALAEDPRRSLSELAGELHVSPHHLSRIFRSFTGETISRHRIRLRVRDALERLGGGEHDLARVAADTGFADQSHLCRVVRRETGRTPSALRRALA